MKKQMAVGIAGATAALIGGFRLVRQLVDRGSETDAVAVAPGMPAENVADVSIEDLTKKAETNASPSAAAVSKKSSKSELYEVAQKLDIEGRSKMSKDELLKAIEAAG